MAEPVTLWLDGESVTVTTPSKVAMLQAAGWTKQAPVVDVAPVAPVTAVTAAVDMDTILPDDFPGAAKLRAVGIVTVRDLLAHSEELSRVPGIGERTLDKIFDRAAEMYGLNLPK